MSQLGQSCVCCWDPLPPGMEMAMAQGKASGHTVIWLGGTQGMWILRLGTLNEARLWPKLVSLKDKGSQEMLQTLAVTGTC